MSAGHRDPLQHPEVQAASARGYAFAFVFGLGALVLSTGLVRAHLLGATALELLTGAIATLVMAVQLRLLLHLDLSRSRVWHTVALALTVPLFVLAIGLTVWMFHTLELRTMLPGLPG